MTSQTKDVADRLRLANMIARRVQIQGIRLVRSQVRRDVLEDADIPETVALGHGVKVKHGFDPEAKRIAVFVTFLVSGKAGCDEESPDVFRVEASFGLDYTLTDDEPAGEEEVAAFAKLNGIYNAWPYWREYVQSTASRMGLPALVLPVLTVGTIEKMVRDNEAPASEKPGNPDEA
jgi:hypothetical protein